MTSGNARFRGSGNFNVYSLTNFGKTLYRFLFGKEPHEAEMDVVIRHHGTLEHGYGILKTAEMISEMAFVRNSGAKVISLTRRKDYAIKTKDNSSYIPDIILIQKMKDEEQRRYLEYETGKCTKSDFFAKCNKIASFSRYLNFIVPNQEVKNYLLGEIEEWKEQILAPGAFPGKGTIHIRVATYDELKKATADINCRGRRRKRSAYRKRTRKERGFMTIEQIIESFRAFNINSINNLIYILETNFWLILSIVGVIAIVIMNLKEELEDYVTEEQNII